MTTPIKLTLVRAGLQAIEKHVGYIAEHVKFMHQDIETAMPERDRCTLLSQQCAQIRAMLETGLRAINAIDHDAQQYLENTDPTPRAPVDRTPLTYRFELFSEPDSYDPTDTFQVRGREEARRYVRNLDAFEDPGMMRIYVISESGNWQIISRESIMSNE